MIFPYIPLLLASLLLIATGILFFCGIRKNGTEKPNWVDMISLATVVISALSVNFYMCVERGCISFGIPVLIVAAPVSLVCLAFPPGRKGKASFAHRIVCAVMCLAACFLMAFTGVTP